MNELDTDKSFAAVIRKALFESIPNGISDAAHISSELGISKLTLHRKLEDENTTYNQQLNHSRELMVKNYLQTNMSLDEIAFKLNYPDANSLSRAFSVWTGMGLEEYKSKFER